MGIITKTINTILDHIPSIRQNKTRYQNITTMQHPINTYKYQDINTAYQAQENPIIYRCNKVYSNTALACNFTIDTDTMEQDTIPTNEYLNRLFHQPEGYKTQTTWADMNNLIWTSKDNLGDCFFEVSTDDNYNIFNGFTYIHNSSITWNIENECYSLVEQPDIMYEPDQIIHIREPGNRREDSPWGVSKLSRAALYIALWTNAITYNNQLINNDGLDPNILINFDDNVNIKAAQATVDRLMEENKGKKRRVMAVKNASVEHMGYQSKDMHYLDLLNYAEDGIIRTYGVPPQLYGKIETANLGSGSGDSQKKDWKITFEGETQFIENAFNNCLKAYGFSERFHYQQMDIIDKMYDAQVYQIYLQNGIMTRDEIRNEMGLDKLQTTTWSDYYR